MHPFLSRKLNADCTSAPHSPCNHQSICRLDHGLEKENINEEEQGISSPKNVLLTNDGCLTPTLQEDGIANCVHEHPQGHSQTVCVSLVGSSWDDVQPSTMGDASLLRAMHMIRDCSPSDNDVSGMSPPKSSTIGPQHCKLKSSVGIYEREFRVVDGPNFQWQQSDDWNTVPSNVSSMPDIGVHRSSIQLHVKNLKEELQTDSTVVQRAAAEEVRLLAKCNVENRIIIANCGVISPLVALLRSCDLKIQEDAVTALLYLSIDANNKNEIVVAGAINSLIHVLKTGSPRARENAAATLFSISDVEESKIIIGQSGAVPPLVDLLANGSARGKKDAVAAIYNLSIFHDNKACIVQAGAVKHLIELMDPAVGMADKAVAVLSNLATIPEGRDAIAEEGGISSLVEMVELGSQRGKENAAAALLHFCTNSNRFRMMVLQQGAIPPLVALSQSGTPRAKKKAHTLLQNFREQRHAVRRSGGFGRHVDWQFDQT